MSVPFDMQNRPQRRKQDILNDVLSFGDAYTGEEPDMDFSKSMINGLSKASLASAAPVGAGADQSGNTIQKAGAVAAPMLLASQGAGGAAAGGAAGTAGTMAALSNPVTAAAIIGGTMLAGGLAQNQANKEARERGANAANYQRQSEIAMDTARQKQNAFNQLMQGYSAALR